VLNVTGSVIISSSLEVTRTSGTYLFNTDPVNRLVSNGDHYGELLSIGDVGSAVVGQVRYLSSTSTWLAANANTNGVQARSLLAITTTGSGHNRGMLVRGYFKNTSWSLTIGSPVYLSTTNNTITSTAPSASGNVVRVVGYAVAADEIYFNPSQDWIEIV